MKKNNIVALFGSIGAFLAIFVAMFFVLQKNADLSEGLNLVGIALIVVGISIVLVAALLAAKRSKK